MKILALDSSAKTASVCVWEDGRTLSHIFLDGGYTHSVTLMPMVEEALRFADVALTDIDRIAVSQGPGSFTGLRIGIGTVKGLCLAADKLCVPVSTLLALAYGQRSWQGIVCAAMDARAGQVYGAAFKMQNGEPVRLMPDSALPAEELASWLEKQKEPVLITGDGGSIVQAKLKISAVLAPLETRNQTAVGVALASVTGEAIAAEQLLPSYLRRPQAERERDKTVI